MPSVAEQELDADPELVMQILADRAYANGKRLYDQKGSFPPDVRATLEADPIVQLVQETDFALAQEALDTANHGCPTEH